ncbi:MULTISPECIES: hypothetical protein [unclassified Streptomyces]|uniref:hypothetical protein n=1 Tax=unclassified Streptomyces TaxID=2593676 RepID=UPI0028C400F8|nr:MULTISPECIES: hypothetical protein [unclassified Streptomyces]WNO70834.1 hypothetical protein RPQ07_04005 [Streptomyces sp. AM8-1-1]
MRHSPRRTGAHRFRRPVPAALAVCLTAAGIAGCAADTGARDDGAVPQVSPPISASPLWPRYEGPTPDEGETAAPYRRYVNVKGIEVPAGDLRRVSVLRLLDQDPNVPQLVRTALQSCPGGSCGLRTPAYRDLTDDGRDELVVALDDPVGGLTLIQVYRAFGTSVRPILISWNTIGATGVTLGNDLILSSTGKDGRFTTRYRWNGTELVATAPQDALGDDEPSGTPVPPADATPLPPNPATPIPPTRTP